MAVMKDRSVLYVPHVHPYHALLHVLHVARASLREHLHDLHQRAGAGCGGLASNVPAKGWSHQWHFQFVPHDTCPWSPSAVRGLALPGVGGSGWLRLRRAFTPRA